MKRIFKVLFVMLFVIVIANLSEGVVKAQSNISFEEKNLASDLAEVYSSFKEDVFQIEKDSNLTIDNIFREFVKTNNMIIQDSSSKKDSIQQLNKIKRSSYISFNKLLTENPSLADKIKYEYKQQIFSIINNYEEYNMNLSDVVDKAIITLSNIDADSTGEEIQNYIILKKKNIKNIINESITLL